ncbi:MAG: HAD-IC family P-type ATPase [Candidatus Paceibacterota bacterium]|jgi:Ca2+-transporting ATPase
MTKEKTSWYNIAREESVKLLKSDTDFGLKEKEVNFRQKKYGKNLIAEKKKTPEIFLFLRQFKNPLIYLIFFASILSLFLNKIFDAIFILLVVLITGATAYFQERKVSRTMEELKKIVKIKATVVREGRKMEINSEELVRGDMVLLKAGDKVPADGRLIEAQGLEVNEMTLTGEWLPSKKRNEQLSNDTVLADRENMVYMGTMVENGTGRAVITAIGKETEMGKISLSLEEEKEGKTSLEERLAGFSKHYGLFVFLLLVLIFVSGVLRKIPGSDLLILVIATGVSAIPEGLLPAVTIILIIGMKRILRKKGLVRKLSTLETLGSVQIILSDKTATLTEGKMMMAKILTGEEFLRKPPKNYNFALEIAALVSEAFIENPEEVIEKWKIRGEPTDKALLLSAIESGINVERLRKEAVKIEDLPFISTRKYHAVLYKDKKKEKILYTVGAPERILEFSGRLRVGKDEEGLDKSKTSLIYRKLEDLSGKGFRVLGLGYKKIQKPEEGKNMEELMENLVFVGILVLKDSLRKEAKKTMEVCQKMGIKPVIVSGDHLLTTKAIAEELGLPVKKENIIEAGELEKLSDKELSEKIEKINVFARIDPQHKLRIVNSWQEKGWVVAMTGDGINDAPALRRADVGLALGSGTDLAKEASDLVLLDDNFSTIISAIEEGRGIFDKIRNATVYLVSNDFTELGFVLVSVLFGFPLPLLPTQILWINVVEDTLPAIALTLEKKEKEVLFEKPRPLEEDVLNPSTRIWMFSIGFITIAVELLFFLFYLKFGFSLERARTFLLTVTAIETFFLAFTHRSLRRRTLRKDIFSNWYLNAAVIFSLFLLVLGIYNPIFQKFLHTTPLNFFDWIFVILCVAIEAVILEKIKNQLFIKRKGL